VLRVTVPSYHESLLSLIYPGDRQACEWFKPAIQALEEQWPWSAAQRQQVVIRTDAGLGTDANINYALWRHFQVLMKGFSGKRTQAWLKQLAQPTWIEAGSQGRAITPAPVALRFGRQTHNYLLRWLSAKGELNYATLISSLLELDPVSTLRLYDGRGADEGEIGSDKSGLLLPKRRKHSLAAQEALILLTDVAHNLLAWLHPWALQEGPLAGFGPKRLVADVLSIPGHLEFHKGRLSKVSLWQAHPYAEPVQIALVTLLRYFDLPAVIEKGYPSGP
jgi:hypothetical protein